MSETWEIFGRNKSVLPSRYRQYLIGAWTILTGLLIASLMTNIFLFFIDEPVNSPDWVRYILGYLYFFGNVLSYWAVVVLLCISIGTPWIFHTAPVGSNSRVFLFILTVLGILVAAYFLWAITVLRTSSIPTPTPIYHPGKYLPGLHDWLDRQNPLPPDYIKIHGEVFRLRALLGAAGCSTLLLSMIPISCLARAIKAVDPRYCVGCGYDLKGTRGAGRKVCPECGLSM